MRDKRRGRFQQAGGRQKGIAAKRRRPSERPRGSAERLESRLAREYRRLRRAMWATIATALGYPESTPPPGAPTVFVGTPRGIAGRYTGPCVAFSSELARSSPAERAEIMAHELTHEVAGHLGVDRVAHGPTWRCAARAAGIEPSPTVARPARRPRSRPRRRPT